MKEPPKGGFWDNILRAVTRIGEMNIPAHAAGCSYFLGLSVFPALVLLLAMLRYTAFSMDDLIELMEGVVPDALLPFIGSLLRNAYEHSTETVISLSALVTLWSASRGIYGLQKGLNAVYGVQENRNVIAVRLLCMGYTVLFLLVLLLTLVLHVFGTTILGYIPLTDNPLMEFLSDVVDFRFFLLLGVQTLLFDVMYRKLPNEKSGFRESLPGALLAAIGWLIFSDVFSLYVENFQRYSGIFGSVYAVALSMLWLYCCISIVFYGAALNRWMREVKI